MLTVRMPAERSTRFWGKCYGQRQGDGQAHYESQGFRPAVVSHPHHPLSALSRREWLTACLQQTPARVPRHFLLYGRCRFQSMCFPLLRSFSPVLARKISSQHPTSTAPFLTCGRNRASLPFPCSLEHSPTSTPNPRAEGSSPSAPANPLVPRPCENRMAWGFFVPMPSWTRSTKSRFMLHPLLSSRIRPQPVSTAVFPSSTQNAPGFAFFGLNRVRFPLFLCFSGAKFSDWLLCILPYSVYKLKPSVIPCRREVSFLT